MKTSLLNMSVILILATAVTAGQIVSRDQVVDVGGRGIHVLVQGQGESAVIFESGFTVGVKEGRPSLRNE